jgi:hypothetical protein
MMMIAARGAARSIDRPVDNRGIDNSSKRSLLR